MEQRQFSIKCNGYVKGMLHAILCHVLILFSFFIKGVCQRTLPPFLTLDYGIAGKAILKCHHA